MFADNDKFDGNNWVAWSNLIRIAAEVRGAMGYLKGKVQNPAYPPQTTTSIPTIVVTPAPTTAQTTTTASPATIATGTTLSPSPTTPSMPQADTSWESLNLTKAEWKACNAWAKGLLIFNTKNPIGLGINMGGTAAKAWRSYVEVYEAGSDLAVANAEMEL